MRPIDASDRPRVEEILTDSWGELRVAASGRLYDLRTQPGLVAVLSTTTEVRTDIASDDIPGADFVSDEIVGVVTYDIVGDEIEVVSIDAIDRHRGVGTALLDAVTALGVANGLRALWLVTTNDNLDGLRFYQRRGLRILRVRPGGVNVSRKLKPSIPRTGAYGIPLRDEIVLGRSLPSGAEL